MEQTITETKEDRLPFDSAVCVRLSDNTKREVKSVLGATEVLIDWPHARRGPVYQETMGILRSAVARTVSVEEAHDAFVAFAEHAGVLVDA